MWFDDDKVTALNPVEDLRQENQGFKKQQVVTDTLLNRVGSPALVRVCRFPSTLRDQSQRRDLTGANDVPRRFRLEFHIGNTG